MRKGSGNKKNKIRFIYAELIFFILFCGVLLFLLDRYQPLLRHYWGKFFKERRVAVQKSRNLKNFRIELPAGFAVHGIDVSRYQQEIDWKDAAKMDVNGVKVQFVFIKATEGDAIRDDFFENNWQQSKKEGLIRGAYHFYRPLIDPNKQAGHFIQTVQLEKGDLPPVLDIELIETLEAEQLIGDLKKWLDKIEAHYRIRPLIYTNLFFYNQYLKTHFKDYPLWLARYEATALESNENWLFWQHSDKGRVNGIAGNVDFNVFKGSREDLLKTCLKN